MSAAAPQSPETDLERQLAARVADLSELVSHLASCWDEDRRQLARQMHDSLGSSMTALTMHLGLLARQLPPDNAALRERSAGMKQLLANIIDTNRKMQLALWNDKLEFLGIKPALAELVADFGQEHGIAARASLPDDEPACTREQGVALLRCAEEGLRNAAAHAHARTVEVILDDDGDQLALTVRDDGTGPAPGAPPSLACHGLRLLAERARALGGTLVFGVRPEGGAALTMRLPRQPGA